MLTAAFLKASVERALKTFAQTLAALLVADGTDLVSTDWGGQLSVAGMAAVISILTSVGSGGLTGGGPSLTNSEVVDDSNDGTVHGRHGL